VAQKAKNLLNSKRRRCYASLYVRCRGQIGLKMSQLSSTFMKAMASINSGRMIIRTNAPKGRALFIVQRSYALSASGVKLSATITDTRELGI
jgi:hypothetical protein